MYLISFIQGDAFPEIQKRVPDIKEILAEEELSFAKTLDRGERLFESCLTKARAARSDVISGNDVFRLYDTFGFPVDLTRLMAEENKFKVDEAGFAEVQNKAKELSRARKGNKSAESGVVLDIHALGELEKSLKLPKTDDSFKYGEFWC
jgi:alanyl-tRNA synthetase